MDEQITHEINLIAGYEDKKKVVHRRVVFGRRITGEDLFRMDTDPQSQVPTQYQDLETREAIVEFGTLPMADQKGNFQRVSLSILLDLDSIDREDLRAGYNEFVKKGLGDRRPVFMPPNKVRLVFGLTIGEQQYDLVEFGRRLTGRDDVQADKLELTGIARMCYRAGRQISKVAIACAKCDGAVSKSVKCADCSGAGYVAGSEIDGPVELECFNTADGIDIQTIGSGAELWRQSFRLRGGSVSGNGQGPDSTPAGNEDGLARGSNSVPGGGAA